jgi:hypothetical protein
MCAPDKFGAVTFKKQWQGSLYSAGGGGALGGLGMDGCLNPAR